MKEIFEKLIRTLISLQYPAMDYEKSLEIVKEGWYQVKLGKRDVTEFTNTMQNCFRLYEIYREL